MTPSKRDKIGTNARRVLMYGDNLNRFYAILDGRTTCNLLTDGVETFEVVYAEANQK